MLDPDSQPPVRPVAAPSTAWRDRVANGEVPGRTATRVRVRSRRCNAAPLIHTVGREELPPNRPPAGQHMAAGIHLTRPPSARVRCCGQGAFLPWSDRACRSTPWPMHSKPGTTRTRTRRDPTPSGKRLLRITRIPSRSSFTNISTGRLISGRTTRVGPFPTPQARATLTSGWPLWRVGPSC
jgi:hypothetical protein